MYVFDRSLGVCYNELLQFNASVASRMSLKGKLTSENEVAGRRKISGPHDVYPISIPLMCDDKTS